MTLSTGLRSEVPEIRHRCLQTLAKRREPEAAKAIVLNWELCDEEDREHLKSVSGRFVKVVRELLKTGSVTEKRLAIDVMAELNLGDALDGLLEVVLNSRSPLCGRATDLMLDLCDHWGKLMREEESVSPIRQRMIEDLLKKVMVFAEHKNEKILDAWLRLAHWDDHSHKELISNPHLDVYRTMLDRMQRSKDHGNLRLLAGYLARNKAPQSILNILTERRDARLAVAIARSINEKTESLVLRNLKKHPTLASLRTVLDTIDEFDFEVQQNLWLVAAASHKDATVGLDGADRLASLETEEARTAAARVLNHCPQPELDEMVTAIQVAGMRSSKERSLGNLILRIAAWVGDESDACDEAARKFLREFTLENLIEQTRHWPIPMCRAMGEVVHEVDTDVAKKLSAELQSPAPKKRLAALQVAQILRCAEEVSGALLKLVDDSRLEVRVRVIDVLSSLGYEPLEAMIPDLLEDTSTDIHDAANRAMRRFRRAKKKQSQPSEVNSSDQSEPANAS